MRSGLNNAGLCYESNITKAGNSLDRQIQLCKGIVARNTLSSGQKSLEERYKLSRSHISRIDLQTLSRYVSDDLHRSYFLDTDFREHYRLIAHLSSMVEDALIFDIGTNKGYSALALSYNPSNKVISYDIVDCLSYNHMEELTRIEFCLGNVLEDSRLASARIIMLDTMHDGVFESLCYAHLKKIGYQGLLFLDDIHLNPMMEKFWISISEPKLDVTELGHWSGSGLVDFSFSA